MLIRLSIPFLLLSLCGRALAQSSTAQTPLKFGTITLSGNIRSRIEAWDWFQGDGDNSYAFSGSILRFSLGQQKKGLDWQVEVAAPILLGLPENAVAPGAQGQLGMGATYFVANDRSRNTALPFVKQAFIRIKALGGNEAHSLRLGRIEWVEGAEVTPKNGTLGALRRDRIAHRLIGHFGWAHVGRSLDGLQYVYNKSKNNFTFVGARPTRGVFQVDGWGELNIGVFYGGYTRQVGAGSSAGELRLFGIYYDDWRDNVLKTDNRPTALRRADQQEIRIGTAGGNYTHAFQTGSGAFDVLFWGVLQTGRWGVQDHRAGSFAAEAGYQPGSATRLNPWFRGGFSFGSGDGNPNDNRHTTFFQILPTPRIYARFPFYNLMNNKDAFGEVILRPSPRWNIRGDVHALRLANTNDLWYQGGGAFQPWTFGYTGRPSNGNVGMATMTDVSVDYQVNSRLTLGAYFANVWGRGVIERIYPQGKNGRFGYLELGYRF